MKAALLALWIILLGALASQETSTERQQEVEPGAERATTGASSEPNREVGNKGAQEKTEARGDSDVGWLKLIALALGSSLFVKILDIAYSELSRRRHASTTARITVETHLDPILKAADELVGKLRSLAEEDFTEFRGDQPRESELDNAIAVCNALYLFAHFWARLEILRKESVYVQISSDRTGRMLWAFLRCLESRRVRLLDRARTRAIGESLLVREDGRPNCVNFRVFVEEYLGNARLRDWFLPLAELVNRTTHPRDRQRFLLYGAVLHSMIDTLDPTHAVTRDRPAFPNKLTKKTRASLIYRVFRVYLPDVRNVEKYTTSRGRTQRHEEEERQARQDLAP